jgi:hypothetical protein
VEGAIAVWGRYAQQAPSTLPRARQLRGHLTLLRREAARRFVQRTTAAEAVTGLRRTDRPHVAELPAELRLSASALVDPATAARPGRLLGAGTVVGGEVLNAPGPTGPGSGRYRLSTAVGDVSRGRLLGQAEIEGLQSEFFVL